MKLKQTLVSLLIGFSLFGCGGDGSSNQPPLITTLKTIKVIDGYLMNVKVCEDKNNNQACDLGEERGVTNKDGLLTISMDDAQNSLLAYVIANSSEDSDSLSPIIRSYTMIATADVDVITPFTTLAFTKNISLKELASQLNIDEMIISGDYVEKKIAGNMDALKAHFIARSVAGSLPLIIANADQTTLDVVINKAKELIVEKENLGKLNDLNHIRINVDELGRVTEQQLFNNLEEYLTGQLSWINTSFNTSWLPEETLNTFNNGILERSIPSSNVNGSLMLNYKTNNNELTYYENDNEISSDFIFLSPHLALTMGRRHKDLQFWIANLSFEPQTISKNMFSGKTWYLVGDSNNPEVDINVKPNPKMQITYQFKSDTTGTIQFIGEAKKNMTWNIVNNALEMLVEGETYPRQNVFLTPYARSNGVMLIESRDLFLLIDSKDQVNSILKNWNNEIINDSTH